MLRIRNVCKKYVTGELTQTALNDVNLNFRDNEFVAVLGPSGSGKTTLLNVIGGLDRYDSGDLIINDVSTKKYKDRDWDSYRNHTIGFVFQNYNLIPHQNILSNVELALTISGISKSERRRLAREALKKVGLGDQLHKKPNQMSGGQMQRVAIARALVNNPDILLADEPTGALDSETSVQVMNLLKEVAKDRLVIMVTHNPELARQYANRIVQLKDGSIIDDSNPFKPDEASIPSNPVHKNLGKTSMSFLTALSLSLNNLRTKKARTILTAFAGSIGIIGIALILSLSNGINSYIEKVQKDTLSTYPLTIEEESMDLNSMISSMMSENSEESASHELDKVYSNNVVTGMLSTMSAGTTVNDLAAFKEFLESGDTDIKDYVTSIQYGYDLNLQIYRADSAQEVLRVSPSDIMLSMVSGGIYSSDSATDTSSDSSSMYSMAGMSSMMSTDSVFEELLSNEELLESQYDVVAGRFPSLDAYDEIVVVVNENNEISDLALYSLGLMDPDEYTEILKAMLKGDTIEEPESVSFTYDDILNTTFSVVLNTDYYEKNSDTGNWDDKSSDEEYMKALIEDALQLKVVGIIRPNKEASATAISGNVAYTPALTEYISAKINESEIVNEQLDAPDTDVFTGMPFDMAGYLKDITMEDVMLYMQSMPEEQREQYSQFLQNMPEEEILNMFKTQISASASDNSTYETNLEKLGVIDLSDPSSISIYPIGFEEKDTIADIIEEYNQQQKDAGHEELAIVYTDIVGVMMSSVTKIVNVISYVLIGFVSISLVVSSIMIGIITYISVLERTKEIGILRSIGASKRNVSGIFNAETLIVGFISGAMGIAVTILLTIPANMIIENLTDIQNLMKLPPIGAVMLIIISMLLTLIAGILPSRSAAKRDPVTALRTE